MWLSRGTPGSAPGWQAVLQSRPAPPPGERHQGCHAEVPSASVLAPQDFSSHAAGTAELLSEHCFARNALQVMWLSRETPGSAPGWQALLQSRPAPQPGERHQGCHAEVPSDSVLAPQDFPSHAAGTAGSALTRSSSEIRFRGAGWWYFRENCEIRAASRR